MKYKNVSPLFDIQKEHKAWFEESHCDTDDLYLESDCYEDEYCMYLDEDDEEAYMSSEKMIYLQIYKQLHLDLLCKDITKEINRLYEMRLLEYGDECIDELIENLVNVVFEYQTEDYYRSMPIFDFSKTLEFESKRFLIEKMKRKIKEQCLDQINQSNRTRFLN